MTTPGTPALELPSSIPKQIAPFAGESSRRKATTAAMYYGECWLQGIPTPAAEGAADKSQDCYTKWWLQQSFQKYSAESDCGLVGDYDSDSSFLYGNGKRESDSSSKLAMIEESQSKRYRVEAIDEEKLTAVIDDTFPTGKSRDFTSTKNRSYLKKKLKSAKAAFLEALRESQGEPSGSRFNVCVEELYKLFTSFDVDMAKPSYCKGLDGVWLTMSNPKYQECLGRNSNGDYMYTLGRMSFDMFCPTDMVCSVRGVFNPVSVAEVTPDAIPTSLKYEIREGKSTLRTYNIIVSFRIESKDGSIPPVNGVMVNYGFILPDPKQKNRFSVWFTGGTLKPDDSTDLSVWFQHFGIERKEQTKERATQVASKVLLGVTKSEGMDRDGSMAYCLTRPIGGHGVIYVDVLYCDKSLRIIRGVHGSIYVFSKVPSSYLNSG